ncbi:unnamed protein product, partial [Dovyalis caffra]
DIDDVVVIYEHYRYLMIREDCRDKGIFMGKSYPFGFLNSEDDALVPMPQNRMECSRFYNLPVVFLTTEGGFHDRLNDSAPT